MAASNTTKAHKPKKIDGAVEIFKRHLPTRDTLSKREFRANVVADIKKELDVSSAGTLGMYFAWADQLVTGRGPKQYILTAPRAPKGSVKAKQSAKGAAHGEATDAELNKLVASFGAAVKAAQKKGAAKKAATKKPVAKKAAKKAAAPTNLTPKL
jgi:hypothetical protein